MIGTRRLPAVAGIVFALGWPLVLAALQPVQNLANLAQDVTVVVVEWSAVLVLFFIAVRGERVAFLRSVGLGIPKRVDWIIAAGFAIVFALMCVGFAFGHVVIPAKQTIVAQAMSLPFAFRVLMVFTAGVCEEICFRGYAISRMAALTKNTWLAALVAAVLFTLGHLPRYGLSSGLAGVFVIGAILSLIYVWRRNLVACIALHWLIDGVSLLIVPAFVTLK